MAFDDTVEAVQEFAEGITIPVLLDRQHLVSELYAISNVPTVIWIDEDDNIVRPNGVGFSIDMFKEFTGFDSTEHLDAIRAWVRNDVVDVAFADAKDDVGDLSDDEVNARLHFRVAAYLARQGDDVAAARHFAAAGELAPNDFTIRRAAMPLQDVDPFGEKFFELYGEWASNGSPYHGIR